MLKTKLKLTNSRCNISNCVVGFIAFSDRIFGFQSNFVLYLEENGNDLNYLL